jgi:hypothetical protein
MRSVTEYRLRAEQCIARAEAIADPVDRARWLQLAQQWALLSRVHFQTVESPRNEPTGMWRGDIVGRADVA